MEVGEVDFVSHARKQLWVVKVFSDSTELEEVVSDGLMCGLGYAEDADRTFAELGYTAGVVMVRDPDGGLRFPRRSVRQKWKDRAASESLRMKWVCR